MTETLANIAGRTVGLREFLTDQPVGKLALVDVPVRPSQLQVEHITISVPDLQLFCAGGCQRLSYCNGVKTWAGPSLFGSRNQTHGPPIPCDVAISYSCETCGTLVKSYALRFATTKEIQKIAEWPPFAPRTPARVMSLVGPDRDLFLKGRRAEIEGLGIAAYAYYRRIIEDQKDRLLEQIIRVARHLNTSNDVIDALETAKAETQFSKAVESVKEAIPDVLRIRTHNPLTLLHSALSKGLHAQSDEECLTLAGDIRLILVEFAEKLTEAMKDQQELSDAVSRLVNRTN